MVSIIDFIIDAAEFKFDSVTDHKVNSLVFKNCNKNRTVQLFVGILPTDDSMNLIEIYRGSNIGSETTGKYGTNYLAKEHLN